MVQPDKTIETVIGQHMEFLRSVLIAHGRSGLSWDEFAAKKLDPPERELLARLLSEARRIGYFAPAVKGEEITWLRVLHRGGTSYPPCVLCERECSRAPSDRRCFE